MANKREVLAEITDSFFKSIYRKATPKANKFLLSDGAIVDEDGNEIEKSEFWKKRYKEAEPIPLKYLHSDGSIDEIGGGGITPVTEPIIEVDENTTLNNIQADTKVIIEGENITLTLGNAGKGIIVTLLATTDPANIVFNTTSADTTIQDVLQAGEVAKLVYIGERWEIIQEVGQITSNDSELKPFGTLLIIGEAYDKIKYPRLFNFIGTKHNQDGDSEDVFRLPDYRECTLVGVGHNSTNVFDSTEIDPSTGSAGTQAHDEYTLGEFKDDQFQGHWHHIRQTGGEEQTIDWFPLQSTSQTKTATFPKNVTNAVTDGTNGTPRTGTTTHGKQIGVNYLIKY